MFVHLYTYVYKTLSGCIYSIFLFIVFYPRKAKGHTQFSLHLSWLWFQLEFLMWFRNLDLLCTYVYVCGLKSLRILSYTHTFTHRRIYREQVEHWDLSAGLPPLLASCTTWANLWSILLMYVVAVDLLHPPPKSFATVS